MGIGLQKNHIPKSPDPYPIFWTPTFQYLKLESRRIPKDRKLSFHNISYVHQFSTKCIKKDSPNYEVMIIFLPKNLRTSPTWLSLRSRFSRSRISTFWNLGFDEGMRFDKQKWDDLMFGIWRFGMGAG